jgi:DNA-binding transcriptional LysR family regulator
MHLGRLATLREVADRGTIAAAADALHLTPSAVSQQLSALEREVGHRLVEPSGRTIRLTPAASLLVERAGTIFAEVERTRAELAAHAAGERATVNVGAFPTALVALVAPAISRLRDEAPGVQPRIVEVETPDAIERLAREELDLVVAMEAPGAPARDDARFDRLDILRDRLDAVLPDGHRLAGRREVRLADLADEPWIAPSEGWSCEHVFLGACQAEGFSPGIVHRSTDWLAVVALVQAGMGVALVPRLARGSIGPGVAVRPLAGDPAARHIFAAWRRGADSAPTFRAVVELLAEQGRVLEQT